MKRNHCPNSVFWRQGNRANIRANRTIGKKDFPSREKYSKQEIVISIPETSLMTTNRWETEFRKPQGIVESGGIGQTELDNH